MAEDEGRKLSLPHAAPTDTGRDSVRTPEGWLLHIMDPQPHSDCLNGFWLFVNVSRSRAITQREESGTKINLFQLRGYPFTPFGREIMEGSSGKEHLAAVKTHPSPCWAVASSLGVTTIKNGESLFSPLLTASALRPQALTMVGSVLCFPSIAAPPQHPQRRGCAPGTRAVVSLTASEPSLRGRTLLQKGPPAGADFKRPIDS